MSQISKPPCERKTPTVPLNPVKHFEKMLGEPERETRADGMRFFEKMPANAAKKRVVVNALGSEHRTVRDWALKMLKEVWHEIDDNDLLALDDLLKIQQPQIRENAVKALGVLCLDCDDRQYREFAYDVLTVHLEKEDDHAIIGRAVEIAWSIEAGKEKNRSFRELLSMLFEDNIALRQSTMGQIKKYREILTSNDLGVIESMLFDRRCEKQMTALAGLEAVNKPYSTIPVLLSFLERVDNPDEDSIKLAIKVLSGMRQVKEIDDRRITDVIDSLTVDPRFRNFGLEEFVRLVLDDTARLLPPDQVTKKRTLSDPLDISDMPGIRREMKGAKPES